MKKEIELHISIVKSLKLTILTLIMWITSMIVIKKMSNGYVLNEGVIYMSVGWITGWISAHIGEFIIAKQVKTHE